MTAEDETRLQITAGHPTAEELAALVIALALLDGDQPDPEPPAAPSGWSDRSYGVRTGLRPGPHAWRMSGRCG